MPVEKICPVWRTHKGQKEDVVGKAGRKLDKTCPCFNRLCGKFSPPHPRKLCKLNLNRHWRKSSSGSEELFVLMPVPSLASECCS